MNIQTLSLLKLPYFAVSQLGSYIEWGIEAQSI
jgi:hypothetical protein